MGVLADGDTLTLTLTPALIPTLTLSTLTPTLTLALTLTLTLTLTLALTLTLTVELVTARQLRERVSLREIPQADAALDCFRGGLGRLAVGHDARGQRLYGGGAGMQCAHRELLLAWLIHSLRSG